MVHRIVWRVASPEALDFWAERLGAAGHRDRRATATACASPTPRGSTTSSSSRRSPTQPLIADHPEVPGELALQGFHAARAYSAEPERSADAARELEFERAGDGWEARGDDRAAACWFYDEPPAEPGIEGAGTVHHIAWASPMDEHLDVARARDRRRRAPDPGDRPLLVSVDLLPRAERGPVRDRDPRSGLRRRRGPGAPRREADPAAVPRGPARGDRGAS